MMKILINAQFKKHVIKKDINGTKLYYLQGVKGK